jgi:hypothetical protein
MTRHIDDVFPQSPVKRCLHEVMDRGLQAEVGKRGGPDFPPQPIHVGAKVAGKPGQSARRSWRAAFSVEIITPPRRRLAWPACSRSAPDTRTRAALSRTYDESSHEESGEAPDKAWGKP